MTAMIRTLIFITVGSITTTISPFISTSFSENAKAPESFDFLVPVDKEGGKELRAFLECKLWLTDGNFGRMTVMPSWQPEFSVAVYSKDGSGLCYVTLTEAARNLEEVIDQQVTSSTTIKVYRFDAQISAAAASALKRVWAEMLRRISLMHTKEPSTLPTDGETVEFSLARSNGEQIIGQMPDYPGTEVTAFRDIGGLLVKLAKSAPALRPKLVQQIEHDANGLYKEMQTHSR